MPSRSSLPGLSRQSRLGGHSLPERDGRDKTGHDKKNQSIDTPQARRRQLQEMPVGIAEIDAVTAALPIGAALDRDVVLTQALLPLRQLVRRDGEGDVQRPVTVV